MRNDNKVLVGVDGSDSSLHALKESFRITNGWITAVSVSPRYEGDLRLVGVHNFQSLLRAPCDKALREAKKAGEAAGVLLKTVCATGEAHEEIVELAKAEGFDLIVLGRSGSNRIERAFMGNVTARVIGFSPRDVLVIPKGMSVGWGRILLATDGSQDSKTATARAMELAKANGSTLKVISVLDLPQEFYGEAHEIACELTERARMCVDEVRHQAERQGISPECIVRQGDVSRAILDVAAEHGIELIVIGSHGRTGLKRLLMGSVAERVIGQAPCPVLVAK